MTLLSRKTDNALLILSWLHQTAPKSACARTIAEKYGLSKGFVANILKELCQKNFVVSKRGVSGGYVLERPLETVTLAEIVEALEDGFQLTSCSGNRSESQDNCGMESACPIRGPIREMHRRMMEVFNGVTVADLIQPALPEVTFQPRLDRMPARAV